MIALNVLVVSAEAFSAANEFSIAQEAQSRVEIVQHEISTQRPPRNILSDLSSLSSCASSPRSDQ